MARRNQRKGNRPAHGHVSRVVVELPSTVQTRDVAISRLIAAAHRSNWARCEAVMAAEKQVPHFADHAGSPSEWIFDLHLQTINTPKGQPPDVAASYHPAAVWGRRFCRARITAAGRIARVG